VHCSVVEDPRNISVGIDLDDRYVQLRRVRQREIAVLPNFIRNFERRAPDVTAVQGYIVQFLREDRTVDVDDVRQSPIIDCALGAAYANFRPLRTSAKLEL